MRSQVLVGVFERDLESKFLSIKRNRVPEASRDLFGRFTNMQPTRQTVSELFVAIAKGRSKDVDVLGAQSACYNDNLSLEHVHHLLCLDIYTNGLLKHKHESRDHRQSPHSVIAQSASAVCTQAASEVPWGQVLPPNLNGEVQGQCFWCVPIGRNSISEGKNQVSTFCDIWYEFDR